MNQAHPPGAGQAGAPDQIPTLTQDMVLGQVPPSVNLALDARAAEKQALMAMSEELLQNMRPEIERLTADLVQRTLQSVWDKRSRIDDDV
jgi:hypothetical protein